MKTYERCPSQCLHGGSCVYLPGHAKTATEQLPHLTRTCPEWGTCQFKDVRTVCEGCIGDFLEVSLHAIKSGCWHDKPVNGHCAFVYCPNFAGRHTELEGLVK